MNSIRHQASLFRLAGVARISLLTARRDHELFYLELRARVSVVLLASALLVAASSSALAQTSTVSWDRNTDAFTAGYLLSYGTQSGSYSTTVDVGNVVSYPVTLAPGNTYYVVVRAYNSLRQYGPASAEASVAIPALPTPPTATITATLGTSGTASVTWRTTNATTVTVNGAAVALNATASYPITQTTTYTVVATGAGGTATASATVVVPRVDCQMSGWTFTSATAWSACTSGQRTRNETWNRTITTQPSGGGAACGVTQEVRPVSEPCTARRSDRSTDGGGWIHAGNRERHLAEHERHGSNLERRRGGHLWNRAVHHHRDHDLHARGDRPRRNRVGIRNRRGTARRLPDERVDLHVSDGVGRVHLGTAHSQRNLESHHHHAAFRWRRGLRRHAGSAGRLGAVHGGDDADRSTDGGGRTHAGHREGHLAEHECHGSNLERRRGGHLWNRAVQHHRDHDLHARGDRPGRYRIGIGNRRRGGTRRLRTEHVVAAVGVAMGRVHRRPADPH